MPSINTTNGAVWFEAGAENAAVRAYSDVLLAITDDPSSALTLRATASTPSAPSVAAGASVVNAVTATTNLAINIANLIAKKASNPTAAGSLEVEISNESSRYTVVLYDFDPDKADISKVPQPIGAGSSDSVLITQPSGFVDGSAISFTLLVQGISFKVRYLLTTVDRAQQWRFALDEIDGTTVNQAQVAGDAMLGFTYASSTAEGPQFSVYTYGLINPSGQISLVVYDSNLSATAASTLTPATDGEVCYLENSAVAAAAAQADLLAFQATQASTSGEPGIVPIVLSAIFGSITAAANIGNAGLAVAGLFSGGSTASTTDSIEIGITNNSPLPVVVYSVSPRRAADAIVSVPAPLAAGEADTIVMNNPAGFVHGTPASGGTSISISMLVGLVPVTLSYTWTATGNPGRWQIQAAVVGGAAKTFQAELQLFGVQYKKGDTQLRIYTTPIESSTGRMDISIYTMSSSAASAG